MTVGIDTPRPCEWCRLVVSHHAIMLHLYVGLLIYKTYFGIGISLYSSSVTIMYIILLLLVIIYYYRVLLFTLLFFIVLDNLSFY